MATKKVYIWKLGSLEHKVFPNTETIHRLAEALGNWDGKDDLHSIWASDLNVELIEVDPENMRVVCPDDIKVEHKDGSLVISHRVEQE